MKKDIHNITPMIPASQSLPEFTIRALILSVFIAALLAASNVYLALKIGATIAASIPASVLALAILRFFKNSNVLECNMVQTAASAGEGVAAAVAFFLPAMLVLKFWLGFPYREVVLMTLLGGILGALFSVPLRRVLLNLPALRFPEGFATGNVLKAGMEEGTKKSKSLKLLGQGSAVGAIITLAQTGLQVLASDLQLWMVSQKTLFGMGFGFSPAIFAAGYIVGFEVGMMLLAGLVVGWVIVLPILSHIYGIPSGSPYDAVNTLWSNHLRYVGVGTMLVGGIWTLISLMKSVIQGIKLSFSSIKDQKQGKETLRTERDLPIKWVFGGIFAIVVIIAVLLYYYMSRLHLSFGLHFLWLIDLFCILFILVYGFILSTIFGYFCGLVGSSNSPISGLMISVVLLLSLIFLFVFSAHIGEAATRIGGLVIVLSTVLAASCVITGENMQDLKAGQIVGATPWKQQLMIMVGVLVSAFVVGPVLKLLFHAYGMAGIYPHPGMNPAQMLVAPQSVLMASIVKGVLMRNLNWSMVILGVVIGIIFVILDEIGKRYNWRLPPLAVGLGIYLPPEVIMPISIGGIVSYFVKRYKNKKLSESAVELSEKKQQHVLLIACGMVAGSSLMGVFLAVPFVILGSSDALSIAPVWFKSIGSILSVIIALGLCYWFYKEGHLKQSEINGR